MCHVIPLEEWGQLGNALETRKLKNMALDHFTPTLGQNGTPVFHFAPNGMFHRINVVQAVMLLIRLTNLRVAQIIPPVNNIDSTKSKHS